MLNVDPLELEKFSQLAHRWWDPDSEFKPLHEINPLRLDYIDGIAGLSGKTVVDVGCGGGILTEAMAARGANVTGIDLAEKPLKVAQLHLLESAREVEYLKVAAEDLARSGRVITTSSRAWRCSSTCPTRPRSFVPAASS